MQIYRVVTESDGETIKSEGERKTEIKQIDRRFAAVIEEHPSVIILMPKA